MYSFTNLFRATMFLPMVLGFIGIFASTLWAAEELPVEKYLAEGKLEDGAKAMKEILKNNPNDQQARFSLATVQFLQSIEHLSQAHYKYGLFHEYVRAIPILRLPVPLNDKPEKIGYAQARATLQRFHGDLEQAEATLAEIDTTEVKMPLHFGRIRLDLDGDGKANEKEAFWSIFAMLNRGVKREAGEGFVVALDGGDVHWLRGYCHLLMAICDVALAHDWQELFERCAHRVFPQVDTPHKFLLKEPIDARGFDFRMIADAVAAIHLINFEVVEPKRMQSALTHLEATIQQSRAMWKRIQAETDNDHEWIPNVKQTGVIPNVSVRPEMIEGWHVFLNEIEALLKGKKLAPFWRGYQFRPEEAFKSKTGVNVRKIFTEPRRFDLVMWITGTGATPYLEKGELTRPDTWDRATRVFGGQFFGFAAWFN